jgi:hypothetical protein
MREFWKIEKLPRQKVLGKIKRSCRYMLIENHRFYVVTLTLGSRLSVKCKGP